MSAGTRRATAIGHLPEPDDRRGTPLDNDHALTFGPWLAATHEGQPCLADRVLPDGTPDFGRGAFVLFPNQEECLWAERDEHVSRHAYAMREAMPWAELHGLREFKDTFVVLLNLANVDPVTEAYHELERRADREGGLEQEGADLARELAEARAALRAAAAALDAAGAPEAARAAREVAGPEPRRPEPIPDDGGAPF